MLYEEIHKDYEKIINSIFDKTFYKGDNIENDSK